jgi:hypothetical protein
MEFAGGVGFSPDTNALDDELIFEVGAGLVVAHQANVEVGRNAQPAKAMPLFGDAGFLLHGEIGYVNPVSLAQAGGLLAQLLDGCVLGVLPDGLPEQSPGMSQTEDAIVRTNEVIMRIVRMIFGLPGAWFWRITGSRRHKTGGKLLT